MKVIKNLFITLFASELGFLTIPAYTATTYLLIKYVPYLNYWRGLISFGLTLTLLVITIWSFVVMRRMFGKHVEFESDEYERYYLLTDYISIATGYLIVAIGTNSMAGGSSLSWLGLVNVAMGVYLIGKVVLGIEHRKERKRLYQMVHDAYDKAEKILNNNREQVEKLLDTRKSFANKLVEQVKSGGIVWVIQEKKEKGVKGGSSTSSKKSSQTSGGTPTNKANMGERT